MVNLNHPFLLFDLLSIDTYFEYYIIHIWLYEYLVIYKLIEMCSSKEERGEQNYG